MKDRIQVDGVWYVRENKTLPIVEIKPRDVTNSLSCTWESDEWCFEATVILKDEAKDLTDIYTDPWIEITDKRPANRDDWKKDNSDNPNWFIGVLEGSDESMEDANKIFDEQGLAEFRGFISYLIDKGWVVKDEGY
jgi:hypothetical protein